MSTYQSQQGALHCSQFQNNLVYIQSDVAHFRASTQLKALLACLVKLRRLGQASDLYQHFTSEDVLRAAALGGSCHDR